MKKDIMYRTTAEVTKAPFWRALLSASNKVSSMRFMFVGGGSFALANWAIMIYFAIYKLSQTDPGMAVLAGVIAAISGGVIGIITALAGFKAYQNKNEQSTEAEPVQTSEAPK